MKKGVWIILMIPSISLARSPSDPLPAGTTFTPSNNVWQTPVDSAPISPNNAQWMDVLNGHTGHNFHANFGTQLAAGTTETYNGIPYNIVWSSATPRVGVGLTTYATQSDTPPIGGIPIPTDAIAEQDEIGGGGINATPGDQHLLIIDESSGMIYELFGSTRSAPGVNNWTAEQLTIWFSTSNQLRTDGWTSADAAGLPITQGLLRYDEVNPTCNITHAIRMELQLTELNKHIWPARHDTTSGGVLNPPFGMRVRMKANVNVTGIGASTTTICIFNAMKKYGLILADNGGDWYIDGAPNFGWNDTTLHNDFIDVGFPKDTMEVIDESAWIVDPNSAQANPPPREQIKGQVTINGQVQLN